MAEITVPFLLSFTDAVSTAATQYGRFAMDVSSITAENVYPRMNDIPGFREWVGDRVINGLSGTAYAIRNRLFESTLEVKRTDFEDDQYGLYTPVVEELGQQAAELPDLLTFGLLKTGDAAGSLCYDGTPFFGTGHTTYDASGDPIAYSNVQHATAPDVDGPAWYLFSTNRPMRAMIVQRRRPFVLTPRMNLMDPSVFDRGTFLWGVDGRMNAGYGMWQLAYKSYAPLNATYYAAARAAMMNQRRADGVPFGIRPTILVYPPSLAAQARTLLISELVPVAGGGTVSNPWKGSAEPVETEWL